MKWFADVDDADRKGGNRFLFCNREWFVVMDGAIERPFPDRNMFPTFVHAVERAYPDHRVSLRRIIDLDGHFVTRDEYDTRKR